MSPFSVGDGVRLKAPAFGPVMLVEFSGDGRHVDCVWFDSSYKLQRGVFQAFLLEIAK